MPTRFEALREIEAQYAMMRERHERAMEARERARQALLEMPFVVRRLRITTLCDDGRLASCRVVLFCACRESN